MIYEFCTYQSKLFEVDTSQPLAMSLRLDRSSRWINVQATALRLHQGQVLKEVHSLEGEYVSSVTVQDGSRVIVCVECASVRTFTAAFPIADISNKLFGAVCLENNLTA